MGAIRARTLLTIAATGFVLAGCASSGPQTGGSHKHYAVGRPHYTVAPTR